MKKFLVFFTIVLFCFTLNTISEEINLIEKASAAQWRNSNNKTMVFDREQREEGTAAYGYDYLLEDGKKYKKVLYLHPPWKKDGTLIGMFENITIPLDEPILIIVGGFKDGAAGTDGVSIQINFAEKRNIPAPTQKSRIRDRRQRGTTEGRQYVGSFCSLTMQYDRNLERAECSMEQFAGKTGNLVVRIQAGNSSDNDWSCLTELKITSKTAPAAKPKKMLKNLRGHSGRIYQVNFSPNGKFLVTASADRTAKIWEIPSGRLVNTLQGNHGHVFSAAFSPNSRRVVTASKDNTAQIWQVSSGNQIQELSGHTKEVLSAAFSANGNQVVTGSEDGTVKIWQAAGGREVRTIPVAPGGIYSVVFSPNGRRIAVGFTNGGVGIWNVANGSNLRKFSGHRRAVSTVAFNRKGNRLITASVDNTVKLWNVSNGNMLRNIAGNYFYSAGFSPDGKFIVTGNDGRAIIWKIPGGQNTLVLKHASGAAVRSVSFSPNGKYVALGGEDNVVRIWEVNIK